MKSYIAIVIAVLLAAYIPTIGWALPQRAYFRRPTPVVGNPVNHAVFDGSTYLRVSNAAPAGLPDSSKVGTISFDVKFADNLTTRRILVIGNTSTPTGSLYISRSQTLNRMVVNAYNIFGVEAINCRSTNGITAEMGWTHVLMAWNTATPACRIWINGVEETLVAGYVLTTDAELDYAVPTNNTRITVGANFESASPTGVMSGGLANLWFDDTYNPVVADYYTLATGKRVALGATGQLPTGTQPVLFFSNDGSGPAWLGNSGSGGAFTKFGGTLTTDPSPPQYP